MEPNKTNYDVEERMSIYKGFVGDENDYARERLEEGATMAEISSELGYSKEEKQDAYDYAEKRGRNKEFYPDPTYHKAKRRSIDRKPKSKGAPVYISTRSKRYELIGCITRLCDLAGFELADRIVLKDKVTGEILE